jgi:small subunit ribosomal protein S13
VARIVGVDLPQNKHVDIGLTYIYGIGRSLARNILSRAKVNAMVRVKDLSEDEVRRISRVIQDDVKVEGDLRKEVA